MNEQSIGVPGQPPRAVERKKKLSQSPTNPPNPPPKKSRTKLQKREGVHLKEKSSPPETCPRGWGMWDHRGQVAACYTVQSPWVACLLLLQATDKQTRRGRQCHRQLAGPSKVGCFRACQASACALSHLAVQRRGLPSPHNLNIEAILSGLLTTVAASATPDAAASTAASATSVDTLASAAATAALTSPATAWPETGGWETGAWVAPGWHEAVLLAPHQQLERVCPRGLTTQCVATTSQNDGPMSTLLQSQHRHSTVTAPPQHIHSTFTAQHSTAQHSTAHYCHCHHR